MSDDGVGYFLVIVMFGCMAVLSVVLLAGVVAMMGDGIGLWDLPDNKTTCEGDR